MYNITPREVVEELGKHIVGQQEAKKAVAIALRNRYRRKQLSEEIRDEIYPKNIIMIGPTGVGKTEIARRLAKLVKAPFIKVEATKFTEVGYVEEMLIRWYGIWSKHRFAWSKWKNLRRWKTRAGIWQKNESSTI